MQRQQYQPNNYNNNERANISHSFHIHLFDELMIEHRQKIRDKVRAKESKLLMPPTQLNIFVFLLYVEYKFSKICLVCERPKQTTDDYVVVYAFLRLENQQ